MVRTPLSWSMVKKAASSPSTDQLTSPNGLLAWVNEAVSDHSWFSSIVAAAMDLIATEPASSSRIPTSALGFASPMARPRAFVHLVDMPMYSPPSIRVSSTELTVLVNSVCLITTCPCPMRTASSRFPVISA